MSAPTMSGLTYDDLAGFPQDDHLRRELIDGELFVSPSPSTRRLDMIKKRSLYEREGVAEYWFVDLEADQIDVHRLDSRGIYGMPTTIDEDAAPACPAAPGFELSVLEALSR